MLISVLEVYRCLARKYDTDIQGTYTEKDREIFPYRTLNV